MRTQAKALNQTAFLRVLEGAEAEITDGLVTSGL